MNAEQALTRFVAEKKLQLTDRERTCLLEVAKPLLSVGHSQGFSMDFEMVWKWLEYSRKDQAKQALERHFVEGEDFSVTEVDRVSHCAQILLTSQCFYSFCMMCGKPMGKLICRFFSYLHIPEGVINLRREELELRAMEVEIVKSEAEAMKAKVTAYCEAVGLIEENFGMDERDTLFYKNTMKRCLQQQNLPSRRRLCKLIENNTRNNGKGEEISISVVGQDLGINAALMRKKAPLIGRRMAALWKAAHPGQQPPKQGAYFNKNTYFECDREVMEEAIREVFGKHK